MGMMKILKGIGIGFLVLFSLLCVFVLFFAFHPEATEKLAERLYSQEETQEPFDLPSSGEETQEPANPPSSGEGENTPALEENTAPAEDVLSAPEKVADRNGYVPVREQRDEVSEEEASRLMDGLGVGETGDGLSFDPLFYPYYAMLDDTGRHLYRQIYANMNGLIPAFAPIEEISADELTPVFAAVFNDHPELFFAETGYYCKYRRDGRCVEINLMFNGLAYELEEARARFQESAGEILSSASGMDSDFDRERYVHDALMERVDYSPASEDNQTAYSALVNGSTVCAGYARAYQYLLQQMGIPCYYCTGYTGEDHAWNIVAMSDGYYNVDVTWDDAEGGGYTYFNCTDEEYAGTHIRRELSLELPSCNGQRYRMPRQALVS